MDHERLTLTRSRRYVPRVEGEGNESSRIFPILNEKSAGLREMESLSIESAASPDRPRIGCVSESEA
jgi:hypothetical protein